MKNLKFSVLVGTAIKSTETSSWDETKTKCLHFNPYTLAGYRYSTAIKSRDYNAGTQFVFDLSCLFQCFLLQSLLIMKISNTLVIIYYLALNMQEYKITMICIYSWLLHVAGMLASKVKDKCTSILGICSNMLEFQAARSSISCNFSYTTDKSN